MNQRVGLLGGSFDPVHRGHLHLAHAARDHLNLDQVIWLPAAVSLHKLEQPPASASHRLRMLELALADHTGHVISTVELDTDTARPTVETVGTVAKEQPTAALWFLMGADSLASLPAWVRPRELMGLCRFGVLARPGADDASAPAGARVDWIPASPVAISSRQIREQIAREEPTPDLTAAVRAYIDEWGLYRGDGAP